jgi:phosphoribosylformylglycinamidine synthase
VIEDASKAVGIALTPGLDLVLVGETKGELGQSLWLREICGEETGAPPPVNLAAERANGDFVRAQILAGNVAACHDLSDGGLLVAVSEMALAGDTGVTLTPHASSPAFWFGEDQARYLLAVPNAARLLAAAKATGIPAEHIGQTGGNSLTLSDSDAIFLSELRGAHEGFFPDWFA